MNQLAEVINLCGEKWIADFDMPDGSKNMAMTNSHEFLTRFVKQIRSLGGKNIVIRDETPFFLDRDVTEE